jgi:hypothetical protein
MTLPMKGCGEEEDEERWIYFLKHLRLIFNELAIIVPITNL